MLATRLVRLIESHSQELSRELLHIFRTSSKCAGLLRVSDEELQSRSHEIFSNLTDYLQQTSEVEFARRYTDLGVRRHQQKVPFSDLVWALQASKEHLHAFVQREGFADTVMELHAKLEMLWRLDRFFDQAIYWASVGYEQAEKKVIAA